MKNNIVDAMKIGCETKMEYSNIITQITQYQSTKLESQKQSLERHITSFQQSKTGKKTYFQETGQIKQLKKENNQNSTSGFMDALLLTLIVMFVIGMAVSVGYMLYKINIGG